LKEKGKSRVELKSVKINSKGAKNTDTDLVRIRMRIRIPAPPKQAYIIFN
jgi:hypothetical protein